MGQQGSGQQGDEQQQQREQQQQQQQQQQQEWQLLECDGWTPWQLHMFGRGQDLFGSNPCAITRLLGGPCAASAGLMRFPAESFPSARGCLQVRCPGVSRGSLVCSALQPAGRMHHAPILHSPLLHPTPLLQAPWVVPG